jgi:hypothetical protein
MKRLFTLLVTVLITVSIFSQSPEKMSYQAVVRNASGNLVVNSTVGMRIQILQTSETGPAVYVETHSPATNVNGLVTLVIGGGTVVFGTFAGINWANGPYFINVGTDVTGGINYTLTGVSQILSVPYALHAKSVASYPEIDPLFSVHPAKSITGVNITEWNSAFSWGNHASFGYAVLPTQAGNNGKYLITNGTYPSWGALATVATNGSYNDLANKPTTDGSETKITAGTGITLTGAGTTASPYVVNAKAHYIGESYGGGIVFYVYDNGQHGLIAATSDQSTGMRWNAGTDTHTMAKADGVGAGKANTAVIIANQGYGDGATYAARICNEYSVTVGGVTYSDWYLPSKSELNLLYLQKSVVGGFTDIGYWSSTEYNSSETWFQRFWDINTYQNYDYKIGLGYVRAIRAF